MILAYLDGRTLLLNAGRRMRKAEGRLIGVQESSYVINRQLVVPEVHDHRPLVGDRLRRYSLYAEDVTRPHLSYPAISQYHYNRSRSVDFVPNNRAPLSSVRMFLEVVDTNPSIPPVPSEAWTPLFVGREERRAIEIEETYDLWLRTHSVRLTNFLMQKVILFRTTSQRQHMREMMYTFVRGREEDWDHIVEVKVHVQNPDLLYMEDCLDRDLFRPGQAYFLDRHDEAAMPDPVGWAGATGTDAAAFAAVNNIATTMATMPGGVFD